MHLSNNLFLILQQLFNNSYGSIKKIFQMLRKKIILPVNAAVSFIDLGKMDELFLLISLHI